MIDQFANLKNRGLRDRRTDGRTGEIAAFVPFIGKGKKRSITIEFNHQLFYLPILSLRSKKQKTKTRNKNKTDNKTKTNRDAIKRKKK